MITLPSSGFSFGALIIFSLGLDRPRVDIIHSVQTLHRLCFRGVFNIIILILPWDSLLAIVWRWVNVTLIIVVVGILVRSVILLVSLVLISILSLIIGIVLTCITIHLIIHRRIITIIQILVHIITALLVVWRVPSPSLKASIRFVLSWLVVIWQFYWFLGALKRSMA